MSDVNELFHYDIFAVLILSKVLLGILFVLTSVIFVVCSFYCKYFDNIVKSDLTELFH